MIELEQVRFRYPTERFSLEVAELKIGREEATAIIGPSGCGKSTLLKLIAGILRPQEGRIHVLDRSLEGLSEEEVREFRIRNLGLVFQELELLDYLTASENILLPYRVSPALPWKEADPARVEELASDTGISHLLNSRPGYLSQGERQRVAICRALITGPKLLLADEPTGSLDPENQRRVVALLRESAAAAGAGLVMVTHERELLGEFERVIDLPDLLQRKPETRKD